MVGAVSHRVRPATPTDAPTISTLNRFVQSLHHEHRPDRFTAPDAAALTPVVEQWLRSEHRRIWLAEDSSGSPVGYVMGVRFERPANALVPSATVVELDQVVVDPVARGRGIATSLCEAVLQWAEEVGADRVELSTWAFNDSARSLFARLGFTTDFLRQSRSAGESRTTRDVQRDDDTLT